MVVLSSDYMAEQSVDVVFAHCFLLSLLFLFEFWNKVSLFTSEKMELSAIYDFLILLYFQKHFTIQCALQEEAKVPRRKPK